MRLKRNIILCLFQFLVGFITLPVAAQNDSLQENKLDSLLLNQKGFLGKLAKELLVSGEDPEELQRADIPFQRYTGKVIRSIIIRPLDFGISIGDTTKYVNNKLTRLSNNLHRNTREKVIRNHLFFRVQDKVSPFLLANNERYLRDLPFLNESKIIVRPVKGSTDRVDVIVITKDVLSLGGAMNVRNTKSLITELQEDNLFGWGDRLKFQGFYDGERRKQLGYGGQFIKRNIRGSFVDVHAGFRNFQRSFSNNQMEEHHAFTQLIRPLVNPYMKFTYGVSAEWHKTNNFYQSDSLYKNDYQYAYSLVDAWGGWNLSHKHIGFLNEFNRLRYLLSARVMDQHFSRTPLKYSDVYNFAYADRFAVLGSVSLFQLNFYKTGYIYGFGRREDIPQGVDASITTGWTQKAGRDRLYGALQFQRFHLTRKEAYFNYTLSAASYFHNFLSEDISLLANLDYFSSLRQLGRWKQRFFLNGSIARQFRHFLEEPLVLESKYGLQDYEYDRLGGKLRLTTKAESVFFSPWQLFFFKMAPFVFSSATLFRSAAIDSSKSKIYPAVGAGLRIRNESLVFGTVELKGVYFPRGDRYNTRYALKLSTNMRFKYNQNFIRRPEFIQVN